MRANDEAMRDLADARDRLQIAIGEYLASLQVIRSSVKGDKAEVGRFDAQEARMAGQLAWMLQEHALRPPRRAR